MPDAGGGRQAEALVLLHAAGAGPRSLSALASHLKAAGARILAPALPMAVDAAAAGTGRPLTAQIAAARAALAEAEGTRPPIVVGHSLGGLVALLAMLEGARIAGAVLYEPIVFGALDRADTGDAAGQAWDRAFVDDLAASIGRGDPEPAVVRFIEAWNETSWCELPAAVRERALADAADLAGLAAAVHHHPIDREALGRLDVPVLLLTGDCSPAVAQRMAQRLSGLLPRAELRAMAGLGHMGPVKAPAAVAGEVAAWLQRGTD